MTLSTRRAFVVAALFTIAGCGGSHGTKLARTVGHDLVRREPAHRQTGAFFPVAHHAAVQRSIHATYSTKKSLLFETDFSDYSVNIFRTSQLSAGDPSPIATITEPTGGCPYDMALDKKKTLYLADQCLNKSKSIPKARRR